MRLEVQSVLVLAWDGHLDTVTRTLCGGGAGEVGLDGSIHHRHGGLSEQPGHHQHVATLSTARPGRGAQKGRASGPPSAAAGGAALQPKKISSNLPYVLPGPSMLLCAHTVSLYNKNFVYLDSLLIGKYRTFVCGTLFPGIRLIELYSREQTSTYKSMTDLKI